MLGGISIRGKGLLDDTCVFFYARSSRASRGRAGWKRSPGPDEATPAKSKVNCLGSEPPQK